jgi:hypothetical protein
MEWRSARPLPLSIAALAIAGCTGMLEAPPSSPYVPGSPGLPGDGGTPIAPGCDPADAGPVAPVLPDDPIEHGRVLRRIHLVLHGRPPLPADQDELDAATSDAERDAVLARAIDEGLASPDFYERMVDFGHHWLRNGAFLNGAQGDAYWGNASTHLGRCDDASAHPGAYYILAESAARGRTACGVATAPTRDVEPWWAPGTTVTLVGDAASTAAEVTDSAGARSDCGIADEGYFNMANAAGCGCGANAVWCYPAAGLNAGGDRAGGQRRDVWDEPARLVGHLAWHDRPLSDLVLGNYTVATNRMRAWYLRFGRQTGLYNAQLDGNTTWFHPEVGGQPRDPVHTDPADPHAWRELVVEELAPQLLSLSGGTRSSDPARTLRWDPRVDTGPAPGLPFAGVMTMPGPNSSFPRERPRASRFLEIFACRSFDPPPPDVHFPPVGDDLATSGQCMHCHAVMDPVAMAFRRWIYVGGYVPRSRLADLADLPVPDDLYEPRRRYALRAWFGAGASRWRQNWLPGTTMTPITEAELASSPSTLFLDTIPPEYTLFGEHTDGTMGPLGFAKVLVSSGEFDRCAVQRIYERIVGRALDPTQEAAYIESLAHELAAGGRVLRPFVRRLLESTEFRRGL